MTHTNINDEAPDFSLPDDMGNLVKLSDYRGKKIVLYFYPKDDTPGCTTEAKDFRDLADKFAQNNTQIIGISKDSVAKHQKFKCKYDLPFSLISDEEGLACGLYETWVEKSMYGKKYMGIERATYLIDEQGIITHIWRNVKVTGHAQEVLNKIIA